MSHGDANLFSFTCLFIFVSTRVFRHPPMQFDEQIRIEYVGNNFSTDVPIVLLVLLSIVLHSLFFYSLPSALPPLSKSYVVSTIHAFVCVVTVGNFFARYSVDFRQINRMAGSGMKGTGDEMMIYGICYTLGYFIYDLLLMFAHKSARTATAVAHHFLVIVGLFAGLSYRICHPCHFYLLGEELSTIPLNLKALCRDRPRLHHFLSIVFVLTFFSSRIVYGSIICAYGFRSAPQFLRIASSIGDLQSIFIGLSQAFLCILMRSLNFYWAFLIVQKVRHPARDEKKHL